MFCQTFLQKIKLLMIDDICSGVLIKILQFKMLWGGNMNEYIVIC